MGKGKHASMKRMTPEAVFDSHYLYLTASMIRIDVIPQKWRSRESTMHPDLMSSTGLGK
jgi:hypothetical protein